MMGGDLYGLPVVTVAGERYVVDPRLLTPLPVQSISESISPEGWESLARIGLSAAEAAEGIRSMIARWTLLRARMAANRRARRAAMRRR